MTYISAEEVIENAAAYTEGFQKIAEEIVRNCKTQDVAPIKRGIWMKAGEYDEEIVCSLCGRESHDRHDELDEFEGHAVIALKTPRYCGYCGALMRRHT